MKRRYLLDPDKIPLNPGTTVVLQKKLMTEAGFMKTGVVGQVKSITPGKAEALVTVETSGGKTFTVPRSHLAVQKQRVLDRAAFRHNGWRDYRDRVILATVVGSHAWGLNNEHSDQDVKGIFCWPEEAYCGFYEAPREIHDPGHDAQYWEIQKFIEHALNADPNSLEALWSPLLLTVTPAGERLREQRHIFTSVAILGSFGRYAMSQFKKIRARLKLEDESRLARPKNAYNLIRLLHSAIHWVKEGEPLITVSGEIRAELLKIKQSEVPIETVLERGHELAQILEEAHNQSHYLPEEPDFQAAQTLLLELRDLCARRPLTMLASAPKVPGVIQRSSAPYAPLTKTRPENAAQIKKVIFDLDDTLFDCYRQCVLPAHKEAARAMIKAGLEAGPEVNERDLAELRLQVRREFPEAQLESVVCAVLGYDATKYDLAAIIKAGQNAFFQRDPGPLELFDGVPELLDWLGHAGVQVAIVTRGDEQTQMTKIDNLGLKRWTTDIHVVSGSTPKKTAIAALAAEYQATEVLVVGDNARDEITAATELGLCACWIAGTGEFRRAPGFACMNLSQTAELKAWFQRN